MNKLNEFMSGKKTYICAICIGVCAGLSAMGYEIPEAVYVAFAALTGVSLRAAVGKK